MCLVVKVIDNIHRFMKIEFNHPILNIYEMNQTIEQDPPTVKLIVNWELLWSVLIENPLITQPTLKTYQGTESSTGLRVIYTHFHTSHTLISNQIQSEEKPRIFLNTYEVPSTEKFRSDFSSVTTDLRIRRDTDQIHILFYQKDKILTTDFTFVQTDLIPVLDSPLKGYISPQILGRFAICYPRSYPSKEVLDL